MKQCVKISVSGKINPTAYKEYVQKHAHKLSIEGVAQTAEDKESVMIIASGPSDNLDELIDLLYKGTPDCKIKDVLIEPFINERDFRGVFRVIGD